MTTKKVTGIAFVTRPEGLRLAISYCLIKDGEIVEDNVRVNRVLDDETMLGYYQQLYDYAQNIVENMEGE